MARTPVAAQRKRSNRYHHGDLARALLNEAVRTIQRDGVEGLTLRAVGDELGVSRTALYRHFANKEALLGAVAGEGFRTLRDELQRAWENGGGGREGFDAMGHAYVRFALRHPSHYRVMFGGYLAHGAGSSTGPDAGDAAFAVLVNAIAEQQAQGLVERADSQQMAMYIWSVVHGISMLALADLLPSPAAADELTRFAIQRLHGGISAARTKREQKEARRMKR